MGKHQLKLLLWTVAALGLMLTAIFGLEWFRMHMEGMDAMGVDTLKLDLRSMTACTHEGVCASVPMAKIKGFYPMLATVSFWAGIAVSALVLFQAGARLVGGMPAESLKQLGITIAFLSMIASFATGYLFAPETESFGDLVKITVTRTWAPAMLVVGEILAMIAIHTASAEEMYDDADGDYRVVRREALPTATARLPPTPIRASTQPVAGEPPKSHAPANESPRKRSPSSVPLPAGEPPLLDLDAPLQPAGGAASTATISEIARPEALKGKLSYATATFELTAGGIDARREDGVAALVLWSDIVGIVARRLPAEAPYDSVTLVDLVSTAGSTLRVLPWTRISGERVVGEGEERARTLVQLVAARCPGAQMDPATRTFLGSHGHAAQIPDLATLAHHDARLA